MTRLAAVLLVALVPGFATAQESCSLQIVDAKLVRGKLRWTECKTVPVQKMVAVEVEKNGMRVIENRTVTVHEKITIEVEADPTMVKVTGADGKAIAADKLAELLKEATPVVTSTEPLSEKHRALFKDKAIFLELPPPVPKKG